MPDRKSRSAPQKLEADKQRQAPPKPEDIKFITRPHLCTRWDGCSEKAVVRIEKRLGLTPYRFLRQTRYKLSDVERIEAQGALKLPKRFTGLRPDQKAALLERERAELSEAR